MADQNTDSFPDSRLELNLYMKYTEAFLGIFMMGLPLKLRIKRVHQFLSLLVFRMLNHFKPTTRQFNYNLDYSKMEKFSDDSSD